MSKSLRLSEKWFHRALWLVAVVFAGFLVGLGSTLVDDLPKVERQLSAEDFVDKAAAGPLRASLADAERTGQQAERNQEQAELKLQAANKAYSNARETFSNWLATRHATQLPDQDAELIARTKSLDALTANVDKAQQTVDAQKQIVLNARQAQEQAQQKIDVLEEDAGAKLDAQYRRVELRVFVYRLAVMLPMLVVAGCLFAKKRKSTYWPFVWGFIFFALFSFFVELVPYLPSYGGYVRYIVGIVVTAFVGRYAILALNRYLAQQKISEAQPDRVRREELSYDTALVRLAKNVCPACERPVDLKDPKIDFCSHCGIGLFDHCCNCSTRKSAFSRYCHACGTAAQSPEAPSHPATSVPSAA